MSWRQRIRNLWAWNAFTPDGDKIATVNKISENLVAELNENELKRALGTQYEDYKKYRVAPRPATIIDLKEPEDYFPEKEI